MILTVAANRRLKVIAVNIFLIFIICGNVNCQEYSFCEYGVKEGLPQSQAGFIYQDSRGFLWITTRNGLSRFDGVEFINYFRQDGLPTNFVYNLFEDKANDIWAVSAEGLSKYTGSGFRFYPAGPGMKGSKFFGQATPTDKPGVNYLILNNYQYPHNRLVKFEDGKYSDYSSLYPALDTIRFSNILFDTTYSELLIIDSLENFYSWKDDNLARISQNKVYNMYYDRGRILLSYSDSLFEYRGRNFYPHYFDNRSGRPEAGKMKIGPDNVIRYFDGSDNIIIKPPTLQAGVFVDNEGVLWSPSDRNLSRLLSTAFSSVRDEFIKSHTFWAICFDKNGSLWLGTLEGDLFEFDGKSFRNRNDYEKLFDGKVSFYKGSRLLSNGELWLSVDRGVLIWDGKNFSKLKGLPPDSQVCYIYEDPDNHKVILGTSNGIFIISGDKFEHFPQFNDDELGVIEGIVKDDAGFYWFSGHSGLLKFDGKTPVRVNDLVLPEAFTYTIEKDRNGVIWVSSDEGLFCKKKSEENFRMGLPASFNKPANTVKMINDSHLLVGRGGDICIIDVDSFRMDRKDYFHIFDKTYGYLGGDCLDNGIAKCDDGSFWILTSDGIVKFQPERLKRNEIPPKTWLTGLYFETDSLSWSPVRKNEFYFGSPEGILLGRNENKIRISFTGISTRNPDKVTYKYILEGLESKWSLPGPAREAVYDNLPPGQYTFKVKAINADGIENTEPALLKFRIQPSIWETKLFIFLFVLVLVALTILFTTIIIKTRQRQKEEKQKVRTELIKLQISAVLKELDPHFTFNAISSIGYLIMKERKEEAYSYLTRLSSLLRTILYDGATITRTLAEELDFVRNYCELQMLRFEERFTYIITVDEKVEIHREVPKMAIQIFVENAIKHGFNKEKTGGKIEIILTQKERYLEIVVRDNGIGRAASLKLNSGGTGYGIRTVNRIFEIMNVYNEQNALLEIKDLGSAESAKGTEVIIRIPDNYIFTLGH